jgi:hypothetical protein
MRGRRLPGGGPARRRCLPCSLVLHDWPSPQARRILENIAAAGGSGARLLIEFVVPPGDAPVKPPGWSLGIRVRTG